jgi:hypothetical protein
VQTGERNFVGHGSMAGSRELERWMRGVVKGRIIAGGWGEQRGRRGDGERGSKCEG